MLILLMINITIGTRERCPSPLDFELQMLIYLLISFYVTTMSFMYFLYMLICLVLMSQTNNQILSIFYLMTCAEPNFRYDNEGNASNEVRLRCRLD